MIFIGDQIIAKLQGEVDFPNLTVRDFYSVSRIVPNLVTVNEMPGEGVLFPDGMPKIVRNSFQIEVYCKQQSLDGRVRTAGEAARMLFSRVDDILIHLFGLTQVGTTVFSPYTQDTTIIRGMARYRGDIDTRTEIIYR